MLLNNLTEFTENSIILPCSDNRYWMLPDPCHIMGRGIQGETDSLEIWPYLLSIGVQVLKKHDINDLLWDNLLDIQVIIKRYYIDSRPITSLRGGL